MAEAADWIESKYGICVGYEDPAYRESKDVEDITTQVVSLEKRRQDPNFRLIVPRRAMVEISLTPPPTIGLSPSELSPMLNSALLSNNQRGNPGVFRLVNSGRRFTYAPAPGDDGQRPLLDNQLELKPGNMSGLEALRYFISTLGVAAGVRVEVGTVPINTLMRSVVEVPTGPAPARELLIGLLDGLKYSDRRLTMGIARISWRLFHDPMAKYYVLNLHTVMAETKTPEGETVLQPVR